MSERPRRQRKAPEHLSTLSSLEENLLNRVLLQSIREARTATTNPIQVESPTPPAPAPTPSPTAAPRPTHRARSPLLSQAQAFYESEDSLEEFVPPPAREKAVVSEELPEVSKSTIPAEPSDFTPIDFVSSLIHPKMEGPFVPTHVYDRPGHSSFTSTTPVAMLREERDVKRMRSQGLQLPEAPVFRPTAKEFENPLDYIASIRPHAKNFGICRIVPPPEWQPTFAIDQSTFRFNTRLQRTHQLFNRRPAPEVFLELLGMHLLHEGIALDKMPTIGGVEVDLQLLLEQVRLHGGLQEVIYQNKWDEVARAMRLLMVPAVGAKLQAVYYKYLLTFDALTDEQYKQLAAEVSRDREEYSDEPFGYPSGRSYTIPQFNKFADEFKEAWFRDMRGPVSSELIEQEYWKIIEEGARYVCVNYGSDIDSTVHGSGFPTAPADPYSRFGWNLSVLPGLPQSILRHMSGISGISMPWLYIGMLFSSFCWHVEDNFLYSINYMHFGASKTWYGVPGGAAPLMERAFRRIVPDEFAKRPLLLHDLVTNISPTRLLQQGVPVYRAVQQAGEFVITFPRAYHAGFSHGFNCGEAVNFASADWLPYGAAATAVYRRERRPVSLDQDQLLLRTAANEKDPKILQYVLAELRELCMREATLRSRLATGGITRTLSLDDLAALLPFDGAIRAGGAFEGLIAGSGAASSSAAPAAAPSKMTREPPMMSMRTPRSLPSIHKCKQCERICFISLVVALGIAINPRGHSPSLAPTPLRGIYCLECALETSEPTTELALVCRFSIPDLEAITAEVAAQVADLPPLEREEVSTAELPL
eukprot:m.58913 g.58913  ORF g.58913 m.58913 type:complete len:816 (+) comp12214_c0_seq1:2629-5076(+)